MKLKHEISAIKTQFDELQKQQTQVVNDLLAIIEGNGKSLTDRAVFATLELVKKLKRPVRTKEVLQVIRATNIPFPRENDAELLGALLIQEINKKDARLKRISYGTYDKR